MKTGDVLSKSFLNEEPRDILYRQLANCIRVLTMDAVEQAQSGHPGMPLGMADVATILFSEFLNFIPNDPNWLNRDRFILSAGHGSMLLYSLLYLTGYQDISLEDIKAFRQLHSKAAGHPEYGSLSGIETTTGPLGQGLANAVGMEMARSINSANLADNRLLDHKTYVIVGDGCLMEGISHEASSLAGHLKLKNLIILYDSNNITIDGERSLSDSEDTARRFQSYGFHTQEIDGHDFTQIRKAITIAQNNIVPSLIICKTKIAYGTPTKESKASSHGAPLGEDEVMRAKVKYGWPADKKFFIPEELLTIWRGMPERPRVKYNDWCKRVHSLSAPHSSLLMRQKFALRHCGYGDGMGSVELQNVILELKKQFLSNNGQEATRTSSGKVIALLSKAVRFIGGSADLTGSNGTNPTGAEVLSNANMDTNYICYGVREHAMGSVMNGIALYGGAIPYGGSFLVFMDYAKPALRMAAQMKLQVIYVMTHDSIGVGEDGPTHQPIEQLGYLRAVPNVNVFRPADAMETLECWEMAVREMNKPSVICLTRQSVPRLRCEVFEKNLSSQGAYIISEYEGELKVTIFATGSEVSIALDAQKLLRGMDIGARVVSVPCMELLEQQSEEYKHNLLDNQSIKVAIEAAGRFGWDRYIGRDGIFVGMDGFGASAPSKDLYKFFGITASSVVDLVVNKLNNRK
jgi:transketolase